MFSRLGNWCHDHRRLVLGLWVLAFLIGGGLQAAGNSFRDEFNLPDSESRTGFDILDEHFGGEGTGINGTIVFQAEQGVDDPEVEAADASAVRRHRRDRRRRSASISPYSEEGARQIASEGPQAGTIAYAEVEMPDDIDFTRAGEIRDEILDDAPDIEGLRIEMGGFIFAEFEQPSSETLGLAFAIVILILAFGSVLAMGLPVGVALFGIGIGTSIVVGLSHVFTVPETAQFIGLMIGLGVGIDYALLIVTRYREQLHAGHTVRESVAIAMDTAGRSVLFAGTHRGHLAARPAAHARHVRERARPRRRPRGRHHRGGIAHAAAGAARLRRRQGSSSPAGAASSPPGSSPSPSWASA